MKSVKRLKPVFWAGGGLCLLAVTLMARGEAKGQPKAQPRDQSKAQSSARSSSASGRRSAQAEAAKAVLSEEARGLSLDEVFALAAKRTEAIPIAATKIEALEAATRITKGSALPKIDASLVYSLQDSLTGTSSIRGSGPTHQTSARISLSQVLYAGGRQKSALEIAKAQTLSAKEALEATRNGVYLAVARSFYSVLLAEQEVANLSIALKLTQDRIAELKKRARIGRSRSGEVLTADSQAAIVQSQLEAAKQALAASRDRFALQTGLDPKTPLVSSQEKPLAPLPLESYLGKLGARPDLKSRQVEVVAARESVEFARGGHLPMLGLNGNYYPWREGAVDGSGWDASLQLTLPLYEGGAVEGRIQEANARKHEAELRLQQQQREAETEIRVAHHDLTGALTQIELLEKALSATERNYKEQTRDYGFSLVTNLEVLQALNAFQDTRRSLARAKFDALVAWAELKTATAEVGETTR